MSELREIYHNQLTLSSDKWDPYFDVYERYITKYRNKPVTLVEIGVQGGGSIQMWRKFLGDSAKIIGIDIDPAVKDHEPFYDENTKIIVADQGSPEFWDEFLKEHPEIDILIDDGGHEMRQQIVTFEKVFPHITKGGVFICEDTHTSYFAQFGAALYSPSSFIEYSKKLVDVINYQHVENKIRISANSLNLCKDLTAVNFYDSMVVFLKDGKKEFARVFANPKS